MRRSSKPPPTRAPTRDAKPLSRRGGRGVSFAETGTRLAPGRFALRCVSGRCVILRVDGGYAAHGPALADEGRIGRDFAGNALSPEQAVEAPFAAASEPEIEKAEAVDDRQLA